MVPKCAKRLTFCGLVSPNSYDYEQKLLANRRIQKTCKLKRWRFTLKAPSLMFGRIFFTPNLFLLYFVVLIKCHEGFLFILP